MARRTKQDALATRDSILDAAELLFEQQGVSRTTLQHIAAEAGVTRGAIYWRFHDKSDLINALMGGSGWIDSDLAAEPEGFQPVAGGPADRRWTARFDADHFAITDALIFTCAALHAQACST